MHFPRLLGSAVLSALSGCSAHPLVEDFSRKTTYQITQKIRCEAAFGLQKYKAASRGEVPPSAVGFDFTFDTTEQNRASSGKLDFVNSFAAGKFSLTLKGSADKKRQSERSFRLLLTFEELEQDLEQGNCAPQVEEENLLYPITGSIGMDEVIETYLLLNSNLDASGDIKKPVKVFSDTLTFSTTLNAGISPRIEIGAGGGNFKLRDASIDGSAERIDKHKVVIAISTCRSPDCKISPAVKAARSVGNGFAPPPIQGEDVGTNNVIDELDRLRNRDDGRRVLEDFILTE